MMKVVHCKKARYTHYIGRPSPLGNPFKIGQDEKGLWWNREEVIHLFEKLARRDDRILAAIRALPESAILGCWCAPQPCHGDVIVKLWYELHRRAA